jgi:hypothetical protein
LPAAVKHVDTLQPICDSAFKLKEEQMSTEDLARRAAAYNQTYHQQTTEAEARRAEAETAHAARQQESLRHLQGFVDLARQYGVPQHPVYIYETVQIGPTRGDGSYPTRTGHRLLGNGWIIHEPVSDPEMRTSGHGPVFVMEDLLLVGTSLAPGYAETTDYRIYGTGEGGIYDRPDEIQAWTEKAAGAVLRGPEEYAQWSDPAAVLRR